MTRLRRLCVFTGSRSGTRPSYLEQATELGRLLAERDISLVYGGAKVGLMGALAGAALAGGGEVVGVIPHALVAKEIAHDALSALHVVSSMHERKAKMAELSDAFVALPGGFGTLEELFEVITWSQLGLHSKPIGLLNTDGYFGPLLDFLSHVVVEGFSNSDALSVFVIEKTPQRLLDALGGWHPVALGPKWVAKA